MNVEEGDDIFDQSEEAEQKYLDRYLSSECSYLSISTSKE